MTNAISHPHDLPEDQLQLALSTAVRPDLLLQLVDASRRSFGFYTRHLPHTINYPWAAALLEHLPKGARALDIGAGLNPLPLFLAERGVLVECVDHSEIIRTPPVASDWNEWGFFNYGRLHPNLVAHHSEIANFEPASKFDAIYSIGSLSHMPRTLWEATLERCRQWLVPQGILLLALGLIADTDFLWNRIDDPEAEEEMPSYHGSVDDVMRKLRAVGFSIHEATVHRSIPKQRVDMFLLECRTPALPDPPAR